MGKRHDFRIDNRRKLEMLKTEIVRNIENKAVIAAAGILIPRICPSEECTIQRRIILARYSIGKANAHG
jgi:hypothetical protein